jgi:hypothetical protein
MTTLQSFGTSAPEGTRSKLMRDGSEGNAGIRHPNETRLYRAAVTITLLLAAAFVPLTPAYAADPPTVAELAPFSHLPRGAVPEPWTPVSIVIGKRSTRYDLVDDAGVTVLHAVADNAASGLALPLHFDLRSAPIVSWRWKIAGLIPDADSTVASREDAPARIVLEFDGDKRKLTYVERAIYGISQHVAGRELPYATLMYIWSNREPVGTVIANPRTRRVQMIVASSGAAGVGAWQSLTRDVRADFRRAFGEEAGALLAVGVLTDTDNTDGHAEAWYGDIRFAPQMR